MEDYNQVEKREQEQLREQDFIGFRVKKDEDGKYRWIYELSLFKNPGLFLLIWKIFFFVILGIFAFMIIIDLFTWPEEFPERLWNSLKILGYFMIGMTVLVGISYLIYAAIMNGKYVVAFEMDENGIYHRQIPVQAKKAKKLGQAVMLGGILRGDLTMTGVGLNSQRTEMYSDFSKVRKVKARPAFHTIKVNAPLNHNQVYAQKEDFDFVKEFIIAHCPKLKK